MVHTWLGELIIYVLRLEETSKMKGSTILSLQKRVLHRYDLALLPVSHLVEFALQMRSNRVRINKNFRSLLIILVSDSLLKCGQKNENSLALAKPLRNFSEKSARAIARITRLHMRPAVLTPHSRG